MVLSAEQQRIQQLLKESIKQLCKTSLTYSRGFSIEGLLGVTLFDTDQVFLINVNETVGEANISDLPKSCALHIKQEVKPESDLPERLPPESSHLPCGSGADRLQDLHEGDGNGNNIKETLKQILPQDLKPRENTQDNIPSIPIGTLKPSRGRHRRKGSQPVHAKSGLGPMHCEDAVPSCSSSDGKDDDTNTERSQTLLDKGHDLAAQVLSAVGPLAGVPPDPAQLSPSVMLPYLQSQMSFVSDNTSFDPSMVNSDLVSNPDSAQNKGKAYRMRMQILQPEKWAAHKRKQADRMRERRQSWSKERLERERAKSRERMRRRRQLEQMEHMAGGASENPFYQHMSGMLAAGTSYNMRGQVARMADKTSRHSITEGQSSANTLDTSINDVSQ